MRMNAAMLLRVHEDMNEFKKELTQNLTHCIFDSTNPPLLRYIHSLKNGLRPPDLSTLR